MIESSELFPATEAGIHLAIKAHGQGFWEEAVDWATKLDGEEDKPTLGDQPNQASSLELCILADAMRMTLRDHPKLFTPDQAESILKAFPGAAQAAVRVPYGGTEGEGDIPSVPNQSPMDLLTQGI